jgi:heme-binding NEAT domain protein
MTRYLALATGAVLAVAAASYSYAQTTPPGTDRPAGEEGATSAKPNPDKKTGTTKGATGTPKATPTPPGTDRPAGEEGATSAKPDPNKK